MAAEIDRCRLSGVLIPRMAMMTWKNTWSNKSYGYVFVSSTGRNHAKMAYSLCNFDVSFDSSE